MKNPKASRFYCWLALCLLALPHWAHAAMSLDQAIEVALENNFAVLTAREAVQGAEHQRKSAMADFLPKLKAEGNYTHLNETPTVTQGPTPKIPVFMNPGNPWGPPPNPAQPIGFIPATPAVSRPLGEQDSWNARGSLVQPVFTGGALLNRYRLAQIGVESAQTALSRIRQDISLAVVQVYFGVLTAIELKKVADQAVLLLENQRQVSQEYYDVGMIPKNDLLRTEVQLAQRIREQTVAGNNIELAKSQFNLVLQRPLQTPVDLVDMLSYEPVALDLEECIRVGHENRLELKEAALRVKASERQVDLARSAYFPQVQVSLNAFKSEGGSTSALEEGWSFVAGATWNIFEWGKTREDVSAARSQLKRDELGRLQLKDQIALEVKEAFLALKVAEKNIFVAKKAVEQGEESFRMAQERYKEQVGTITDVLDSQTLLTQAQTDYYNALSNYNVAKAALNRAMGLAVYQAASKP
ncbi:MAG: TolC family protein [bacterium]